MKKVRFIFPFDFPLRRQFPSNQKSSWNDYEFCFEDTYEEYDHLLVYNKLEETFDLKCRKGCTVFIPAEPYSIKRFNKSFLNQFDHIITHQSQIKHKSVFISHNGYPWHLEKSHDDFLSENVVKNCKENKILIITSDKGYSKGHIERLKFVEKCKGTFKDKIDVFGRGIFSFKSKADLHKDYKFSIVVENDNVTNYFTEKLTDSFLSLTFPLYKGCTNIRDYFSPESHIDLSGMEWKTVKNAIEDTIENYDRLYDQKIESLQSAQKKCLYDFNFFELTSSILRQLEKDAGEIVRSSFSPLQRTKSDIFRQKVSRLYYGRKANELVKKLSQINNL